MKTRRRAAAWLEGFHEEPVSARTRRLTLPSPRVIAVMGSLDAVPYTATVGGRTVRFKHTFARGARPLLATDGKHLFIIGGRFHVTARGIVDLSPRGRERE